MCAVCCCYNMIVQWCGDDRLGAMIARGDGRAPGMAALGGGNAAAGVGADDDDDGRQSMQCGNAAMMIMVIIVQCLCAQMQLALSQCGVRAGSEEVNLN